MIARWLSSFVGLSLAAAAACGDDSSGNADASLGMTQATDPSTATSTDPSTATSTTDTEASGTGVVTTESGSEAPNLDVCADYIACAMETLPEAIATIIATYGPEGSCWSLPGVTEEDCWTECAARMADLAYMNGLVSACWACEDDAGCPAATPRCELRYHLCTGADEIAHCNSGESCTEGPADSQDNIEANCFAGWGLDHCPAGALGYCTGIFGAEQVVKFYAPVYDPTSAETECVGNQHGVWFPL